MIKKGINIVIIMILSLLFILPTNIEKNVSKAESPTTQSQEFKIIQPYIEYMGSNFYTGQDIIIGTMTLFMGPTNSIVEPYEYNNRQCYILGLRVGYNVNTQNMNLTINYGCQENTTGRGNAVYIIYNINEENGELTEFYTNFDWQQNFGVNSKEEILQKEWITNSNYENELNTAIQTYGTNIRYLTQFLQVTTLPKLQTPILTIDLMTLNWNEIENADYYVVYRNGTATYTTVDTQYTTIVNGNYQVQACVNEDNEEYSNSELSNTIEQNNYNDLIGNGANFFTLFSAIIDSQLYLIKSMLNYELWGINIFNVFKLLVTVLVLWYIYKLIKKG